MIKKVTMQLCKKDRDRGYTMITTLNSEYVKLVKDTLKTNAFLISKAIKEKDSKQVIVLLQNSIAIKHVLIRAIENADKIIYDSCGNSIFCFEVETRLIYSIY